MQRLGGAGGTNGLPMFPCESPEPEKAERAIWERVKEETRADAKSEPLLSSFLYASILGHDTIEQAIAFILANRLANATMLPTQLFETFLSILQSDTNVRCGALADLEAIRERDPACDTLCHALLYFKGYHAITSHRIAHALWLRNQKVLALALQSRMSEVYAVDIHPAARLGKGILLDHGTGVVIGETAVIGNNCSLLQGVTLGGTGKEVGDRHPKVADNVLIGASATILGNIIIGEGAQIAAGSLVLKPVLPHTMVAGSPAKPVGRVLDNPAETMLHCRDKASGDFITASMEEVNESVIKGLSNGRAVDDEFSPAVSASVKAKSVSEAVAQSKASLDSPPQPIQTSKIQPTPPISRQVAPISPAPQVTPPASKSAASEIDDDVYYII